MNMETTQIIAKFVSCIGNPTSSYVEIRGLFAFVDHMPWLVLFLICFLKFFCRLAPYILHHAQLYNIENAKLLQAHDCGERVFNMACHQEVFQRGKLCFFGIALPKVFYGNWVHQDMGVELEASLTL